MGEGREKRKREGYARRVSWWLTGMLCLCGVLCIGTEGGREDGKKMEVDGWRLGRKEGETKQGTRTGEDMDGWNSEEG